MWRAISWLVLGPVLVSGCVDLSRPQGLITCQDRGDCPDAGTPAANVPADRPVSSPPDLSLEADESADLARAGMSNGAPCATGAQCSSGYCPGGLCCAGGCAGGCTNGIETPAATCDAAGACKAATTKPCAPYVCGASACASTCAGTNGCVPGYACVLGSCKSLTSGLVGHWKLDEGQGTVAMDSSGNGNHGAIANGALWSSDGFAGAKFPNPHALIFDGVDDHVTVPDPASGVLDFDTGSFTCALWVYLTGTTSPYDEPIYKGGSSIGYPGYDFELGEGAWRMNLSDGTVATAVNFSNAPLLNQWVHLAGVRDSKSGLISAYVNGSLAASAGHSPGSLSSSMPLTFGSSSAPSNFIKGKLDDVRLYNRALSAAEIAALSAGQ